MKTIILGLAFMMALPAAAHAAEPAHDHHAKGGKMDCCCCHKDAEGKMACCDKMKAKKSGDAAQDPHAGHDMSGSDSK